MAVARQFRRIAVVDRGEPAMRLVQAARELAGELGQALETVALHEEADRAAAFVREADDAVPLDPPAGAAGRAGDELGPGGVGRAGGGFLAAGRVERALVRSGADAVWAGWGPAGGRAELAELGELCRRLGVVFVGPGPEVVRRLGERAALRRLGASAGVPLAPARARAAGGARRLAVEVLADHHGAAWAAGVRHRGVVEESASRLPAGLEDELRGAAARLWLAAGGRNAATVEFLLDPHGRPSILGIAAGLRAGHPVTEATTGLDLVKLQLRLARGEPLGEAPPAPAGHAVLVHLTAEDPTPARRPAPPPSTCSTSQVGRGCAPAPAGRRATPSRPGPTRRWPPSSPGAATAARRSPGCGGPWPTAPWRSAAAPATRPYHPARRAAALLVDAVERGMRRTLGRGARPRGAARRPPR